MASPKKNINYEIFKATFKLLGENEKQSTEAIESIRAANEKLEEATAELMANEEDLEGDKVTDLLKAVDEAEKELQDVITNLSSAFGTKWNDNTRTLVSIGRPEKDAPTRGGFIGKAIQRGLQKLDDICTITGDASLKLQIEKFKVEARLADPDHKGIKRFGDLLLKVALSVAKFVTDAAVKIKAYVHNTEEYRDEVNAGIKAKFSRKGGGDEATVTKSKFNEVTEREANMRATRPRPPRKMG